MLASVERIFFLVSYVVSCFQGIQFFIITLMDVMKVVL